MQYEWVKLIHPQRQYELAGQVIHPQSSVQVSESTLIHPHSEYKTGQYVWVKFDTPTEIAQREYKFGQYKWVELIHPQRQYESAGQS